MRLILLFALGLSALLSDAARAQTLPPLGPVTIADMAPFLVQMRCADGALAVIKPACPGAALQRARDPMLFRRHDWPAPDGFQITDSFVSDDGAYFEALFAFPPFGPFVAAHGDGGDISVIEGPTARASATEDGGQMGVIQGFYGAGCGGTGWILFRNDAPTGRWAELVAHLKGEPIGSACSAKSNAYTRYRLEQVELPFIIDGARTTLTLPTIISEHYNAATLARASALERTYLAKGVGRVIWEAWSKHPATATNLAERCPGAAWSVAPAPGWYLNDCRTATNVVAADGSMSGDAYGWPGPGFAPP